MQTNTNTKDTNITTLSLLDDDTDSGSDAGSDTGSDAGSDYGSRYYNCACPYCVEQNNLNCSQYNDDVNDDNIVNTCVSCSLVLKSNTSFCNSTCEMKYLDYNKKVEVEVEDKKEEDEEEEEEVEDVEAEGEYYDFITSCIYCGDAVAPHTGFCDDDCVTYYRRLNLGIRYTKYGLY